jgi:hypothetical protein
MAQETFNSLKTFSRDLKAIQNALQHFINWGK